MSAPIRLVLAAILTFSAEPLAAQAVITSPSPTLPSDTLEANYAPPSRPGPMPELAPTLPSDTLRATEPVDSFPTDLPAGADSLSADSVSADSLSEDRSPGQAYQPPPEMRSDSAEVRELRTWIERHPGLIVPPPSRAVLAQA